MSLWQRLLFAVYWLKCSWSRLMDLLKCKSVKMCKAFNLNSATGRFQNNCEYYTDHTYCRRHKLLQPILCDQYHLVGRVPKNHPNLYQLAVIEQQLRIEYVEQYALSMDYAHQEWMDYLKRIIDEYEKLTNAPAQARREECQRRRTHVMGKTVDRAEVIRCPIALDSCAPFESDDDWDDDEPISTRFDKRSINLYFFNHNFKRTKYCEITSHL